MNRKRVGKKKLNVKREGKFALAQVVALPLRQRTQLGRQEAQKEEEQEQEQGSAGGGRLIESKRSERGGRSRGGRERKLSMRLQAVRRST
jgi:hypothetical protein